MEDLAEVSSVIDKMEAFVNQAHLPDTLAIASFYKDWAMGEGVGNFLTYGDFPTSGDSWDPSSFLVPVGVILDRDLDHPRGRPLCRGRSRKTSTMPGTTTRADWHGPASLRRRNRVRL
ncbi:MAG: nickel-dependent hydrogenase large subunit [Paracoccaceae bacterium]